VGTIKPTHLVPFFPEDDEKPSTKRGRTMEEDEETRSWPSMQRSVERWFLIFRTNLFMCLAMFPQFKQFDITWTELENFYSWILGPEIGSKKPPPSPSTLLAAERKVWEMVEVHLHEGRSLKEALKEIKGSTLFWQREIYEKSSYPTQQRAVSWNYDPPNRPPQSGWGRTGKSAGGTPQITPTSADYKGGKAYSGKQAPTKGAGAKGSPAGVQRKGKSDGGKQAKGNAKQPPAQPSGAQGSKTWPANWANVDLSGTQYCRKHHLYNACTGSCTRSHKCPVKRAADGYICNMAPTAHDPTNCPNA
jgi:hypothetical protein